MATYSMRVNAAIATSTNTNATLYTAPATGYAIINVFFQGGGGATADVTVNVGGQPVIQFNQQVANTNSPVATGISGTGAYPAATTSANTYQIYVGPSQAVTTTASTGSPVVCISGVEFVN